MTKTANEIYAHLTLFANEDKQIHQRNGARQMSQVDLNSVCKDGCKEFYPLGILKCCQCGAKWTDYPNQGGKLCTDDQLGYQKLEMYINNRKVEQNK